jgi:anti-anti-sigma factor
MFESAKQGTVVVVEGNEPLNKDHVSEITALFEQHAGGAQPRVVLNLRDVPLIDSAGLELLLDLRSRCLQRGGMLQLAAPNPLCRDILHVTGVAGQFAVFDDVVAAVGSFSQ